MNHVDRILERAKRATAKLAVGCVGSLAFAAALIILSPKTATTESPLLPNNLLFANSSGLHTTFSTSGSIDLRNEFPRISAPMAVPVEPATGPRKVGPLLRLGCRHDSTGREEPIRSSAPMTARTRPMPMFQRSQRAAPLTACCSRRD